LIHSWQIYSSECFTEERRPSALYCPTATGGFIAPGNFGQAVYSIINEEKVSGGLILWVFKPIKTLGLISAGIQFYIFLRQNVFFLINNYQTLLKIQDEQEAISTLYTQTKLHNKYTCKMSIDRITKPDRTSF
jgi:hypothetical protein